MATGELIYFRDRDSQPVFDAEDMMQKSMEMYGSPGVIFGMIAADIPDEHLVDYMQLAKAINEITFSYLDTPYDERDWVEPSAPDFTRAQAMPDGSYKVPVADRSTLQDFFFQHTVQDAVGAYYQEGLQSENDPAIEAKDLDDLEYQIAQPLIASYPTTVEPLDPDTLFELVREYYWSEEGEKKYVTPANTLLDVAKNLPSHQVLPLILAIESRFPLTFDGNDTYERVIGINYLTEPVAEQGIVWDSYSERGLRFDLEYACTPEEVGFSFSEYNGFNDEQFNEEFSDLLDDRAEGEIDDLDQLPSRKLLDEQHERHEKIHD